MSNNKPFEDDLLADLQIVSHAWHELDEEQPPPALDEAIRAAARREVRARPVAVSRLRPWRWQVPLATAAVAVLSVTVTLVAMREQPDLVMTEDHAASMHVPAPELSAEVDQEAANDHVTTHTADIGSADSKKAADAMPDSARQRQSATAKARTTTAVPAAATATPEIRARSAVQGSAGQASQEQQGITESDGQFKDQNREDRVSERVEPLGRTADAETASALGGASATSHTVIIAGRLFPADAPVTSPLSRPAPADERAAAKMAPSPASPAPPVHAMQEKASAAIMPAPPPPPAVVMPAPAPLPPMAPAAQSRAAPADAVDWLRRIERLQQQGHIQEARQSLEKFRQTYPHYPVPDSLLHALTPLDK